MWVRWMVVVTLACAKMASATIANAQTVTPGLPQDGDLSLAAEAGTTLVGLTIDPPQPGANSVYLYLLPFAGPAVAADLDVSFSINGQQTPLEFCSRSCRTAAATNLVGGEELDVDVRYGPSDDVATFQIPNLPTADGTDLLNFAQARMHVLQSYAIDETLGPADPPIRTQYLEVAPDKTSIDSSNGYEMRWIGPTRYSRRAPTDAWTAEDTGSTLAVPMFVWDPRLADQLLTPQIIGEDSVDGHDTQVLAFYMALGQSPFWFRLWVDATGLVLRAEMRGRGHFMDQRFSAFDSGLTVVPPG